MEYNTEFVDPKIAYLTKIVNAVDEAQWWLSEERTYKAMQIMASLLSGLTIDNGEQWKAIRELQHEVVYNYDKFMGVVTSAQIRQHKFLISEYLNATYLKDFKTARPANRAIAGSGGRMY